MPTRNIGVLADVFFHPGVVDIGQGETFHRRQLHSEVSFFFGSLGSARKRQLFANLGADELLVKIFGDPALADLIRPVFDIEPGKLFAITGSSHVERDVVT